MAGQRADADPRADTVAGTSTWAGARPGPGDRASWQAGPDGYTKPFHRLLGRLVQGPGSDQPLRRERDGRLAGGVLAGISAKTGVDVTALRVTLVALTVLTSGFTAAIYVLIWLLLPVAGGGGSIAARAVADKRGIGLAAGLASLLGAVMITASAVGAAWLNAFAWPLIICACGMVLIWRNAEPEERALLDRLAEPLVGAASGRAKDRVVLRAVVIAGLVLAGLIILLTGHERFALLVPLAGLLLVVAGIAVAFGPWWLRIARDLVDERQARVRAEERADMAAHVHDSVLQTLALIQRRAAEPQQVVQLARMQERELRAWLFDGHAPGTIQGDGVTLAAGVRRIQQDVEVQHRISVDAVTVGDCELDDELEALLAAAREATVNAAKWSGAETVSLFAEVETDSVSIFVRDRGRGFDPDAVSPDRKGLAESVRARMTRRGGSATVRSAPGEGTEVSLTMPRNAGDRLPRRS